MTMHSTQYNSTVASLEYGPDELFIQSLGSIIPMTGVQAGQAEGHRNQGPLTKERVWKS